MRQTARSFVAELAASARKTVAEGYYSVDDAGLPRRSILEAMRKSERTPIIAEVKFRSPAEGSLRPHGDVGEIAGAYQRGGVVGISVLTEPKHFEGRLEYATQAKRSVSVPVLMKDVIIDAVQIDAAERVGADVVLLMASIFTADLAASSLDRMIEYAHDRRLEVLLEAHSDEEFRLSLETRADLVGINNRDLQTLEVSLDVSRTLLRKKYDRNTKLVICESGISKRSEILELSSLGADGFLIGSAIMKTRNLEQTVRSLTGA
jgi:indole-3-glycerol phosphate synthase